MKGTKEKAKSTHRRYWRYDLADFDKAQERIKDTDWNTLLKNDNINVSWINWKNKFYETMYWMHPSDNLHHREHHTMVEHKACKWHEETECSLQKGEATENLNILAIV